MKCRGRKADEDQSKARGRENDNPSHYEAGQCYLVSERGNLIEGVNVQISRLKNFPQHFRGSNYSLSMYR